MIKKHEKEIDIRNKSWIDWVQVVLIGLAAPFFLFPSMRYVFVLFIVPAVLICRRTVKKQFFERTGLDWAIIILSIQVFATCIIVPDVGFSLSKIAGVIFGFAFFYAIVGLLISEKLIKWGLLAFLGSGVVLSIVGILGIIWKKEIFLSKNIPRIKWNLPGAEEGLNPNALGGTLLLVIPLSLVLFFPYFKRKKENYFMRNKFFG